MADKTQKRPVTTLPDEGFAGIHQVLAVIPVSRSGWYQGIKDGRYPAPQKLGRLNVWPVSKIRALLAD